MAGLLDYLNSDDGRMWMGMLAAAGPQQQPMSIAQRASAALGQIREQKAVEDERRQRAAMQALQMQQAQQALAHGQLQQQQAQQAAADQAAQRLWRQNLPSPRMQASQQALSPGGGPTMANAAAMPKVDPQQQMMFDAMKVGAVSLPDWLSAQRKDNTPIKVAPGEALVAPGTFRPLFTNPKEQTTDEFTRALQGAGIDPASPQGRTLALQHLTKMATHQPGTQVSVNTGQRGLDNTLKLRGDFRSEPVYKAHQEMQSAHSQIQQSLKAGSAIGDTAAATKIMKLLDPGSVVRESELGMALAATGLADKVGNFAQAILTGQRLNPQQRKDFAALADTLYTESVKQYNAKRGEYQGIAERNALNVPDVVGMESSMPAGNGGWSIKPKGP